VLINRELSKCAFLFTLLLWYYPCYYLALSFYSCTCWVPTISVFNLTIFPYYSNLLLRRRWTEILWRGVLGYVLPRLPFLWSYGVFRCSVSLRVVIVLRDITYVIIILYSWYLVFWEPFWSYVWNNLFWAMHTMSTWFWHKNRVWQCRIKQLVRTCCICLSSLVTPLDAHLLTSVEIKYYMQTCNLKHSPI
jgi:hypothetical protein